MFTVGTTAVILCVCASVISVHSDDDTSRTKRDVSGLFPFPRVGRAEGPWASQYSGPAEGKRQGLIPFPRVGRGGPRDSGGKRDTVQGSAGGMWFGPRLGRLSKRELSNNGGWALVQMRDLTSRLRPVLRESFTPRLGRDSSEETNPQSQLLDF